MRRQKKREKEERGGKRENEERRRIQAGHRKGERRVIPFSLEE